MTTTVHLNIGTNIGDRRAALARAVASLSSRKPFAGASMRLSKVVESPPWGYESPNPYLNQAVAFTLVRTAPWDADSLHSLLDAVQQAERDAGATAHRNPDGTYRDRTVDIDIIAVDELIFTSPRLTLPHPRMHLRPFVAGPLLELAPGWRHPAGKNLEML